MFDLTRQCVLGVVLILEDLQATWSTLFTFAGFLFPDEGILYIIRINKGLVNCKFEGSFDPRSTLGTPDTYYFRIRVHTLLQQIRAGFPGKKKGGAAFSDGNLTPLSPEPTGILSKSPLLDQRQWRCEIPHKDNWTYVVIETELSVPHPI